MPSPSRPFMESNHRSPAVSVLLPVRDAAGTLDEALASIRGQTFRRWELVAVNDGSGDDSGKILERHATEDPRIHPIHLSSSRGIVHALTLARERSSAPILARMDADDRSEPSRLEEQAACLEANPDIALCGTHVRYFPRASVRAGARRYEAWLNSLATPGDLARNLWVECPLAHPSFAMRASAFDSVGGYREMGWPEDYDLVLRLWAAGLGLGVIPRILLHWREGAGRLSRIDPGYSPAAFRKAKMHFLRRTLLRDREGFVVWGAGRIGKAFAREALSWEIPVRAFVELNPRKVGQEIHGAPVLRPEHADRLHGALHVAAVGQPGARERILEALRAFGWEEGREFVAVA